MDWTAGYASDVEYVAGFYKEQSPVWLNFIGLINGVQPVALDRPFNYFELGFGRGLTVQMLAASHPAGQFYAADFNPSHVAGANALTTDAGLENLTLLENSFEELAAGKQELPQFDFITMHGIYTWVTAENQRHIINFLKRYLKPGGIVYVSYNALPGWAAAMPLQRLMVEFADIHPGRSDQQVKGALDFIGQMQAAPSAYLLQNSALDQRLEDMRKANPHYLVHEYMHKHWKPLFHADVARDLAEAKLHFVGSADPVLNYPPLYLNPQQMPLLEQVSNPEMRETLKDYLINTSFRKDVFVRGGVQMGPVKQREYLAQIGLVLTVPRAEASLQLKLTVGEVGARADLYGAVFDALASGPKLLAELAQLPVFAAENMHTMAQIAALLTAAGQAEFYFAAAAQTDPAPAHRLNRVLAAQVRYGDEFQALSSPLIGNCVPANFVEQMFYLGLVEHGVQASAEQLALSAWRIMAPSGRRMQRDGVILEDGNDNLQALFARAQEFIQKKLPIWQHLRLL